MLSVLLIALSYNVPSDSTDIVPLKLDMYRYPKAIYSSDNETFGRMYGDIVKNSSGSVNAVSDSTVTNGN